jgi:DNA (cytosine-5)-methyltransferase 1
VTAIYNEIEPYAAQWLRNLSAAGHIAPGVVDTRSIRELKADDVRGYEQAHFFAGIAAWSHALRTAGWPDDLPVWTGSAPCQPFSTAGRAKGFDDDRHLWPEWFRLIRECRPAIVLGEQVASPDGLKWLDLVSSDLEREDYAFGATDICAAGVGAPHIRQRLYFVAVAVAVADRQRLQKLCVQLRARQPRPTESEARGSGAAVGMGNPYVPGSGWDPGGIPREEAQVDRARESNGCFTNGSRPTGTDAGGVANGASDGWQQGGQDGRRIEERTGPQRRSEGLRSSDDRESRHMANAGGDQRGTWRGPREIQGREVAGISPEQSSGRGDDVRELGDSGGLGPQERPRDHERRGTVWDEGKTAASPSALHATSGFWSPVEWLPCQDGRQRPTQPGLQPLAHGASNRVGKLRAYGNALCAPVATTFVEAVIQVLTS